jgi:hypothetical protein
MPPTYGYNLQGRQKRKQAVMAAGTVIPPGQPCLVLRTDAGQIWRWRTDLSTSRTSTADQDEERREEGAQDGRPGAHRLSEPIPPADRRKAVEYALRRR